MNTSLQDMAIAAKKATSEMAKATTEQKNTTLEILQENLKCHQEAILHANRKDVIRAQAHGLSDALLERLSLKGRLEGIIQDIGQVINLPDPIGETFEEQILSNQMKLSKCRTPIGVLGVIYESRPNVTLDISALAIKSGNCAILRGGSETLSTNRILVELIQKALIQAKIPAEAIQMIQNPDREEVNKLLQFHEYIDLIIPRGSSALQEFCRKHSTIPVVTGGIGICHLYVDKSANLQEGLEVIINAKTQRPTVCNALDTLLIHSAIASDYLPKIVKRLSEKGVSFRLDEKAMALVKDSSCYLAESKDWSTEWLSLVLGIKIVENLEEAVGHIQQYGSGHSDGILTEDLQNAELFIKMVDSAAVYVNASTRFTDGGQFGLGAEVAISTQKIHARGPMGLKELTSYKWIIRGAYHIRP
jgi:glutamate-5-semialdehyde dehydrogenase